MPCALGRSGCKRLKREGDGASPSGEWPLRYAWYRPDKVPRPSTRLRLRAIAADDGWCDAPADRNYNRPVRLPYSASTETMRRTDDLYDLVVVLGHNDRPRVRGLGSAIFIHCARPGYTPTEGCIALSKPDLLRLLRHLAPGQRVRIP